MLQYGHKLNRRMITSYGKYSIIDSVDDCLGQEQHDVNLSTITKKPTRDRPLCTPDVCPIAYVSMPVRTLIKQIDYYMAC